MTKIILNADDFGRSPSINAAVLRAHQAGVLTSASLMITGDAAESAVAMARDNPALAVGLHVVIANGRAALPPPQIPHLTGGDGLFSARAAQSGLRYFLSRTIQKELMREMREQFDRFAATGLPLSHVDSHMHMHVIPPVFTQIVSLAEQYGARGFRLPRDDLRLALRYDSRNTAAKTAWAIVFGLLCRVQLSRLQKSGLAITRRVYGLLQSGQMCEGYVIRILREINVPTAELYFHPSVQKGDEPLGPNPDDLATLLSPSVRNVIEERGLRLSTYPTLPGD
jgi:hopanoid biosynthesis associated protein HpnK